jgi:hypothetical protein
MYGFTATAMRLECTFHCINLFSRFEIETGRSGPGFHFLRVTTPGVCERTAKVALRKQNFEEIKIDFTKNERLPAFPP